MDVRLPMTIRSRGNWSVLYVRIVCVTTLPKCLVHMVSSLEDKEMIQLKCIFLSYSIHLIVFLETEHIFQSL